MSIFGNVAEIAAEPMEELAETASLRDAGTTAGIATDEPLALSSDPQANQQHLHEHLQPVDLIGQFSDAFSVGRRGCVSVGPRYRDLRGPIAGEAVVTLATPEYPFRLPVASPTSTR
jgi:hypothetical protein